MTTFLPSLQYSLDELCLDTKCLFDLVLSDPEFDGLLPNISHSAAMQAVEEAMRVLLVAPAPQVLLANLILQYSNIGKLTCAWYFDAHLHGLALMVGCSDCSLASLQGSPGVQIHVD